MRILVVCQYYHPEPFRIADLCEALVQRGHGVLVVTGVPNYPMGRVYDGYGRGRRRREIRNGVEIHRCQTIARRTGTFFRILNYISFAISSSRHVDRLPDDFDAVLVHQLSPVLMAHAGIRYKKRHGTRLVLHCLDLWPHSLISGGIPRESLPYRVFEHISRRIYRQADLLLVASASFTQPLVNELGVDASRVRHLPQYAEDLFSPDLCAKRVRDGIDLMFAGNVGRAQSVDTIVRAASLTSDVPGLRWHVVGEGTDLVRCRNLAKELGVTTIFFHGRHGIEDMPALYATADAMLVTLRAEPALSMTLPGKVQTYLAAGKAILGAVDGEAARLVTASGCGLVAPAEDAEGLADRVRTFCASDNRAEFGRKARACYDASFSKSAILHGIEEALQA